MSIRMVIENIRYLVSGGEYAKLATEVAKYPSIITNNQVIYDYLVDHMGADWVKLSLADQSSTAEINTERINISGLHRNIGIKQDQTLPPTFLHGIDTNLVIGKHYPHNYTNHTLINRTNIAVGNNSSFKLRNSTMVMHHAGRVTLLGGEGIFIKDIQLCDSLLLIDIRASNPGSSIRIIINQLHVSGESRFIDLGKRQSLGYTIKGGLIESESFVYDMLRLCQNEFGTRYILGLFSSVSFCGDSIGGALVDRLRDVFGARVSIRQ